MTRRLMSYLPYVLRDYTEIQAILVSQQPELDQVWEAAESLLENQFIVSAEGLGLGRWEKIPRHHAQRHGQPGGPTLPHPGPLE